MLKKLLKYELKKDAKFLSIYYIISLVVAVGARVFTSIEGSLLMDIIGKIFVGATISMVFTVLINNVMRLWVRFKGNLYGDESYLTHTLPVKISTIYASKLLAAIITLLASFTAIGATLAIAFYSEATVKTVRAMLQSLSAMLDSSPILLLVILLLVLFLEVLNMLQCGFTGTIIGHRMRGGKVGFSVLFGCVAYSASQLFVVIAMFIFALFDKDYMQLFFTDGAVSTDVINAAVYFAVGAYVLLAVAVWAVNTALLKKGVNVD